MLQNKIIPSVVWIACLTIAAYMLAQAAAVIIRRDFDAALRSRAAVARSRPEKAQHSLPRPNAPERSRTAKASKAGAGRGVKVEQVSDTQWVLDRASLRASTRNLNRFLMQALAVPYRKQGRIVGFRITRISPGSLYEKLGLRSGDVLLRVNDRVLDDPAKLLNLYHEMRSKPHISLRLARNGQELVFQYDIR